MMSNPTQRGVRGAEHVIELDGLRGVLAVCVVLSHIVLWCGFAEVPLSGRALRWYGAVLYAQWTVEVFFILSGFAITYLLHSRQPTYSNFMLGRLCRIYPVYVVCIMLSLGAVAVTPFVLETASWGATSYFSHARDLMLSEREAPWQHLLAHLGLAHGVFPQQVLAGAAATLLVPAWSISVEWQYYLLAPLIARSVRSAVGLLVIAGASWLVIQSGQPWVNPLPGFFPLVLPLFLIGIGSYHLYAAFVAHGARRSPRYGVVVTAALIGAVMFRWHTLALMIWIVAFGSLFVEGSGFVGRALSLVRRFLASPATQFLGRLSYPLYLVHWPLIIFGLALLLHYRPRADFTEALVYLMTVGLPLIVGAAYLLHRTVEAPFMRLGKRLTSRAPRLRVSTQASEPRAAFALDTPRN